MTNSFKMSKEERRRILHRVKDWNKALLPTGKLAIEPCFVQQSVPNIQPFFSVTTEAETSMLQDGGSVQLCLQTKTDWTRNLLFSGIADPSDMQTLQALRFCTTVFREDPELKRLMTVNKKKSLHHLQYQIEAVVDVTDIARLALDFENDLNKAMNAWPTQPAVSWTMLLKIWNTYGFLWPEKLYLGIDKINEHSLSISDKTVKTDDKVIAKGKSQDRPQEQLREYVIICRAKLQPIHKFFPAAYDKQKHYIEAIIQMFVTDRVLESSLINDSPQSNLVLISQEQQADHGSKNSSHSRCKSSSSANGNQEPVKTMNSLLSTRKKIAHALSESSTIESAAAAAEARKRNNDEWKISISPSNSSNSNSRDILKHQQVATTATRKQPHESPTRHRNHQAASLGDQRNSSSIKTNDEYDGGQFSASPATKSSGHTQPTSEFPSPHSSSKSRTVYVDTNVIITVQELFASQNAVLGNNNNHNGTHQHLEVPLKKSQPRSVVTIDDQKFKMETPARPEFSDNKSKASNKSRLMEIAIASLHHHPEDHHNIELSPKNQNSNLDKVSRKHIEPLKDVHATTITATAVTANDSNDLQSFYAESHYTTAAGTIATTGSSVSFDEQHTSSSSTQSKPVASLSTRQLEKQPLRALHQAGFTWDDIPEEYDGEHEDHYAWSTSSSSGGSSISSLPAPTPTQTLQIPNTIARVTSLQNVRNSFLADRNSNSSKKAELDDGEQITEAELYKREMQKKLEAKENAYAAICRNILCIGTPHSNATSTSQIRYYDDIDEDEERELQLPVANQPHTSSSSSSKVTGGRRSSRHQHKQHRTMTPRSKLSYGTSFSSTNLTPEEYRLRRKTRETSFMKLLQKHQESKQKILARTMRQSTFRYWLQDRFIVNDGQGSQHQHQQK